MAIFSEVKFLFELLGDVVLCPEEIDGKSDPARNEHKDRADYLPDEGDGLFEDVKDCQDGQDYTDDVDNL